MSVLKLWNGTEWLEISGIPADHGVLTGLDDDDHLQYHNDPRGDARYYTQTQLSSTSSGAGGAGLIGFPTVSGFSLEGTSEVNPSVQDSITFFNSAGWISGGIITDIGSALVSVSSGTGAIRNADSALTALYAFGWNEVPNISIAENSIRYIGVSYNINSNTSTIETKSTNTWNYNTEFPLGLVSNREGVLNVISTPHTVGDAAGIINRRLEEVDGSSYASGMILGETGTRNVTVSAGVLWFKLNRFTTPAIDTSATDDFNAYYSDGASGWIEVPAQTQWDNDSYDDGSGTLATLIPNRYGNLWFYLESNGSLSCVYGVSNSVSLAGAENESAPSDLPPGLVNSVLLGRIVFLSGASVAAEIQSTFDINFNLSATTDHGNLSGLLDDDHPQYSLVDGTRSFTGTVGGITPASSSDLTTKNYVDNISGSLQSDIDAIDSNVTLQEAYDNGDGVITTTAGKPFHLQGTGELTAASGTFTGDVGIGTIGPTSELEVVGDIVSKGTKWSSQSSPSNNDWESVAYGNGIFVAVSDNGTGDGIMTSPDGVNWTIRSSASDNSWVGITYGNGLFVAVAADGAPSQVMTSPDGVAWTLRDTPVDNQWFDVTYGNGLFVAVAFTGSLDRVMTSPDGINWTIQTTPNNNNWDSITYGNGIFVAIAASGLSNRVMTSPDGVNWTLQTTPEDNFWLGVAYGNGLFVAVSTDGSPGQVMTSPDGITWTSRISAENRSWISVTYGNGLFVAVDSNGTGNKAMTSPDGITWTIRTSAADNSWQSVTYGNGIFVAVSHDGAGNKVMTSGKTEITITPPNNILQGGLEIRRDLDVTGDVTVSGSVSVETSLTVSGIPVNINNDHGNLSGLEDDDHTQYVLTDGSRPTQEPGHLFSDGAGTLTWSGAATVTSGTPPPSEDHTGRLWYDPTPSIGLASQVAITTKTGDYTALTTDSVILVDATLGNITITTFLTTGNIGRILNIKKIDSSVNTVTVNGNGSNIDDSPNAVLTTQYEAITIISTQPAWHII